MKRILLPLLVTLAGPLAAASTATENPEPEASEVHGMLAQPVPVVAPTPSSGLSEDLLDRMRARLVERAGNRADDTQEQ
ncbi:hypothetical protein LVO79_20195 (plasmid) [Roseivivax marinus]|uniref:hypothetical protein n=1 Tax=Roseivivax marinus TaxID=1379903 RepID=UPI001F0358A4|nr:hypothetical protein [Roseivivax marinus]UMA66888.1 hypothetical protein LVO79_20195 [Roseivivax marinus]